MATTSKEFTLFIDSVDKKTIVGVSFILDGIKHCSHDIRAQSIYGYKDEYMIVTSSLTEIGESGNWEELCRETGCLEFKEELIYTVQELQSKIYTGTIIEYKVN